MPESLDFLKTSGKSSIDSLKKVVNQYRFSLIFAAAGLILLIMGAVWSASWRIGSFGAKQSGVVVFDGSEGAGYGGNQDQAGEIVVDVAGAVIEPGVYTLPANSRLKDALTAAGGLSLSADRDWIGRRLNLASPLIDGIKVYIPSQEEVESREWVEGGAGAIGVTGDNQGLININTASSKELETLVGIGPATAGKIIDGRPYSTIEDLRNKKILGAKTFEKLKDKLTVY